MELETGSILNGRVTGITKFGAFVDLGNGKSGMVHISEVAQSFVKDINEYLKEGQEVKVKVISVGEDGKVSLSIKKALPKSESEKSRSAPKNGQNTNTYKGYSQRQPKTEDAMSFEEMMNRFKQSSDEKMSDLKRSLDGKRGSYSRRGSRK